MHIAASNIVACNCALLAHKSAIMIRHSDGCYLHGHTRPCLGILFTSDVQLSERLAP